ncbi:MAG: phosphopantetheine-binding protein [Umezawaea sp.]
MDEAAIFAVVRQNVLAVLPEVDPDAITPDRTLTELGANSIDRADVTALSMDDLGVAVPVTAFAGVASIGDLVQVIRRHA